MRYRFGKKLTKLEPKSDKSFLVGYPKGKMFVAQILHTNVYKPLNTSDIGSFQHFITLTNDCNWYGYMYLMKHKSEYF